MSSFFDELPELEFEPELLLLPPLGLLSDFPSSFLEDELLLFPELSELPVVFPLSFLEPLDEPESLFLLSEVSGVFASDFSSLADY